MSGASTSTEQSRGTGTFDDWQSVALPGLSAEGLRAQGQLQDWGNIQQSLARALANAAGSPASQAGISQLRPEDQAVLDQSYQGAIDQTMRDAQILGQNLAGRRGLRMTDSPVGTAVGREVLPVLGNLRSQKASQQLNLGVNIRDFLEGTRRFNSGMGLNLLGTNPSATNTLYGAALQQQMAQPTQHSYGTRTQQSRSSSTPSPLQQASMWMGTIGQGLNMVGQLSGLAGLGGLGGLGSAGLSTSTPSTGGLSQLQTGIQPFKAGYTPPPGWDR